MPQTAVTEVVGSLDDLERFFGARRTSNENFFEEWQQNLPPLSQEDCRVLDQLRDRFRYQRNMGPVAEGAVNAIVISPLLSLVGFYDAPFRMRSEASIAITTEVLVDPEAEDSEVKVLRGQVDFLVLQDQFWQAVIESKETSFDIEMGIPQILTYMMGAPASQNVVFGMVSNGNHFVFVKLRRSPVPEYEFSDIFSMIPRQNRLYDVFQVLKRISSEIHSI
ncbi:MAG: type I restriction endonuclease subunit R [Alkalinema sp. RU_4_3]|nr:type I restriction endonuclease subunit R [Alkalinema sp. RU_4_3]